MKKALYETSLALQHALNDHKKTLDSSLDVICRVSGEGRFIQVSAACEEVWGYTAEELIGRATIDFVYPDDRKESLKTAEKVRSGQNVINFENRYVHKNGTVVPMSWAVRWDEKDQIRYAIARNNTEKKKLELALEIERQRFYDLFWEAPMSMGVLSGPDHIFESANPLYLELIGKSDIIGRSVKEVMPEIAEQGFIEKLDTVYHTGKYFSANETLIQLEINGKITDKYLNFSYQAHRSGEGVIDGIFFFVVDVTEQVVSRKKIEISESRLNDAQAIARMGNWEIDMLKNEHYWSVEIYKLFGIQNGDIIPSEESFLAFVHPDDRKNAYQSFNYSFQTLENNTFHFRFIQKDGSVRHAYTQWKFTLNEAGIPTHLSGIMQDVTGQKESEEQLRNSEAFSRGVLNSLNSNIAVIDFSGNIIAVNESWKSFGRDNGQEIFQAIGTGYNYFDVCEAAAEAGIEFARPALEGIKEVRDGDKAVFYLEYPCHSLEEDRWFGMRVNKFEGGEPLVVISHQNITERILAESERTKAADELTQRNKDLEQFTYIVSHNLRTPVANIQGLVSILNSEDLSDAEAKGINQSLNESVTKLDEVVKDLNQILHLRDTRIEKNELVQFSNLVENIKISIKNNLAADVVEINYDFREAESMPALKSYIYSIFYNLITNSIKYRQPDIPCIIKISSYLTDNKLHLSFKDNGLGIDLSKRGEQVFGLYKRFHTHVEGKGLGLYMVKTQVEKLGGKISVESEVNKGTEFRIEFER